MGLGKYRFSTYVRTYLGTRISKDNGFETLISFQVFLMAIVVQINWIMEFWQLVMELLKVEKITGWSKILGVKNGDVMDISNLPEIRTTNVELQLWLPILKFECVFLFLKMWFLLLFISIHELFIDFLKNFWQIINLNN